MDTTRFRGTHLIKAVLAAAALAACLLAPAMEQKSAEAAFLGENGKIAFASDRDGNYEIYTMNADGSNQTRITNDSALDYYPAWSPDGTKIAFSKGVFPGEIYVMDADGSNQTNLTNTNLASEGQPAWSPDGAKIAFTSYQDNNFEIYVMDADGSNRMRLTSGAAYIDLDPTWSPDGTKIAFTSHRDGDSNIYVMNADGSNETYLAGGNVQDLWPAWSPDGTKIAYTSEVLSETPSGSQLFQEIYTTNADGSGGARLTEGNADNLIPTWSPDGTKIAFMSNRDGNYEIYTMGADGANQTRLTDNPAGEQTPAWQPVLPARDFGGFFRPVDNPPRLNVVKAGRAVPVKFSLGEDEGLDIFAQGYPESRRIDCSSTAVLDGVEETVSAGNSGLSYNETTGRYTYVWKTRNMWGSTCRQLVVRFDDGTVRRANFKFR